MTSTATAAAAAAAATANAAAGGTSASGGVTAVVIADVVSVDVVVVVVVADFFRGRISGGMFTGFGNNTFLRHFDDFRRRRWSGRPPTRPGFAPAFGPKRTFRRR